MACNKLLALLLLGCVAVSISVAQPLMDEEGDQQDNPVMFDDYAELIDRLLARPLAQKRSSMIHLFRRSCIQRTGGCDHRPNDCCSGSTCRCNLWGTNCRCQRAGLFQQWGK